jgi:alkylhydroperoxidase family enzyme
MAIAACHLQDEGLVASVMRDAESAAISGKLKALLAIAGKVQESGRAVRPQDIARARDEGATDREIHDAVLIAAVFCMYNRYVDGLATWTPTDPDGYRQRASLVAAQGYRQTTRSTTQEA